MNKNREGREVPADTQYAGRGMGGGGAYGGGRPDYKPQIPEEFKEIMKKKQEDRMRGKVIAEQA
jgi:hypothetical protein